MRLGAEQRSPEIDDFPRQRLRPIPMQNPDHHPRPPYGSERCLSGLRLAAALAGRDDKPAVSVFLMSDATILGLPNQIDRAGNGLQGMVEQLVAQGVDIRLCRTCALARGLAELPLIPRHGHRHLVELAEATILADKVITF